MHYKTTGGVSPVTQSYYYKINGKNFSKAEYNNYTNKPGSDEPGKSTNDPDASGRIAKREVARSKNKASKRPTALTEKQTELKDQGTKAPKKQPPFKARKGQTLGGTGRSPLHFDWKSALDYAQTGLTAAGTIPGFGMIADGINTATSLGRAGYAKATGDTQGVKDHMINAGTNAAMMIPVVGQGVAGAKLAYAGGKEVLKQGGKELAKAVVKKGVKKGVKTGVAKGISEGEKIITKGSTKKNKSNMTMNTTKSTKKIGKNQKVTAPKTQTA